MNNYDELDELDKLFLKNNPSNISLFLEKELMLSDKLTVNAKLAYITLRLYRSRKDYVVYDYLKYILTSSISPNKSLEQKIKQGISELIKKDYVTKLSSTKNGAELLLEKLYFEAKRNSEYFKPYIVITLAELHSIMNLKQQSPENILIYYCGLISTINNSSQMEIGDKSIAYLAELSRVSKSTIIRYNRILTDNNILHIEKSNQAKTNSKGQIISSLPNIYSRPHNKGIAQAEQLSREQEHGKLGYKNLSTTSNKKRSLAMKLNQIRKGNGDYSLDEIIEIIRYIENEIHNISVEIKKRHDEIERGLLSENQFEEQVKALNEKSQQKQSELKIVQEYYNKTELRINDEHDEQFLATLDDKTLDYDTENDNDDIDTDDMNIDDFDNDDVDSDSCENVETQIIEIIKKYYYPYVSNEDLTKLRKYKKDYGTIKTILVDSIFRRKFYGLVPVGMLLENIKKEIEQKIQKKDQRKKQSQSYTQYQKETAEKFV